MIALKIDSPLAAKMSRLADRVKSNASKRKAVVAINIANDLVNATPVRTGLAQSNWQITTGSPASGIVPIGSRPEQLDASKDVIFITNNVPYIQQLNDGSSLQAPAGFIETALARFHSYGARISLIGGPSFG